MISRGFAAAAVAVALVFAGCGDGDEPQQVDEAVEEATDAVEDAAPDEAPSDSGTDDSTGAVEQVETPCPGADSPPNITQVTAFNELSCDEVEAAMDEIGAISESFEIGQFGCGRISGGEFGGTWECADFDGRYFRFDFAD